MKLNSKIHGIIDYAVVLFLFISPKLFNLPSVTALVTYIIAVVHFTLTILTDFELGIIKVIPLKIHGWIELIVSIALVGLAFLLGGMEGDLARNFYLAFAAAVFITYLLTDYKGAKAS